MTHPDVITTSIWEEPGTVDLLKSMWLDGSSATQIAAAMTAKFVERVTRNMVLGKAARLKLQRRNPVVARQAHAARQRTVNGEIPKKGGAGAPGQAKPNHIIHRIEGRLRAERARQEGKLSHRGQEAFRAPGRVDLDDEGVDVTSLIGIMDLNAHTCRWPIGDPLTPDFGFCGQHSVEGKPYCEFHSRRAYQSRVPA
jgi:GcrA cell cycle regulator